MWLQFSHFLFLFYLIFIIFLNFIYLFIYFIYLFYKILFYLFIYAQAQACAGCGFAWKHLAGAPSLSAVVLAAGVWKGGRSIRLEEGLAFSNEPMMSWIPIAALMSP